MINQSIIIKCSNYLAISYLNDIHIPLSYVYVCWLYTRYIVYCNQIVSVVQNFYKDPVYKESDDPTIKL